MILGTWNLETYPSPSSPKGMAMQTVLNGHAADVWFLTELHADFHLHAYHVAFSAPRIDAPPSFRKAAIASRFPLQRIPGLDHPAEGRLCLARLILPDTNETMLAVSTAVPWRGATPQWRAILGQEVSYADVYEAVLMYMVARVREERLPGEDVIWGGDFNQGLVGRDYVGTLRGREALTRAFDSFGLSVPTRNQAALIRNHPAIDHIAIPATWPGNTETAAVYRPMRKGRHLSDHALYLVDTKRRYGDIPRIPGEPR